MRALLDGVRLVLFDLDGTLLQYRPTLHEALLAYAAQAGQTFEEATRQEGLHWIQAYWADIEQVRYDRERLTEEEAFWANFIRQYLVALWLPEALLDSVTDAINRRFQQDFAPESYLAPGTREMLWRLRTLSLMTGLISNRDEPLTGIAIELGLIESFDFTLAAGQVGSKKPDPAIFHQALALAGGVSPQEAIYVGDNYYTDVIGSRRAGIRAVLLDQHNAFTYLSDECLVIQHLTDLTAYLQ